MLSLDCPITDGTDTAGQFIPIDGRAITDGVIHAARLQGFPGPFRFIERRVEHREVCVQQRVERTTARVSERGSGQITRGAVFLITLLANSGCGEGFEFAEGNARGVFVRRYQTIIVQRHRQHRNRFWCGTGKIIKHAALVLLLLPLGQPLTVLWIPIFTKRLELVAGDDVF